MALYEIWQPIQLAMALDIVNVLDSPCTGVGCGNCTHCLGTSKQFKHEEQKFQNIMETDSVFSSSSKKKGDRKINTI